VRKSERLAGASQRLLSQIFTVRSQGGAYFGTFFCMNGF
jgi:hypothetical protein